MVCYDCLNFELVNIRLRGHTYLEGLFDIILILCSSFTKYDNIFLSYVQFEYMLI
jgi:hypothetical protein